MTAIPRAEQIDSLMEQASQALAGTAYFQAERLADEALGLARQESDFARMSRILMPLWEARRQRFQLAIDASPKVRIVEELVAEEMEIGPGCLLIRPPQVGADARRLRLMALQRDIPVAVLCREPLTSLKLCPVVAISPGVTVRMKIDPPDDPENPDIGWFVGAMEELGEFAVDSLDPGMITLKRLDQLMGRLDAMPEQEVLHQALQDVCQRVLREQADDPAAAGMTSRPKQ